MQKHFLILLILINYNSYSQKYNSITFQATNIWFRINESSYNMFEQYGLNYTRTIFKKASFSLGYSQWYRGLLPHLTGDFRKTRTFGYLYEPCYTGFNNDCIHEVYARENYKFIDLMAGYKVFQKRKVGNINTNIGISVASGKNYILDTVILPTVPPYDVFETEFHSENRMYFGITSMLAYNFYFWKDRILFGSQIKMRKYFGYKRSQYEWGFHLGLNF